MAYLKPQTPLKDLNSGDYFYPLTTIDQIQKSDGSRVQDYDLGNVALEDSETAPGPGTPQMTTLMNMVYPIGSIYMSVNATSPASLFGGTWEQIQDRFLLAAGSTYSAGSTGGSATHTHTIAHTHDISHTHTMAHTHSQVATTSGGPSNNTSGSTAITVAQLPSHRHDGWYWYGGNGFGVNSSGKGTWRIQYTSAASENGMTTGYTGSGQGHTHTLSSHTHTTAATTTGGASNATTSAASTSTSGAASNANSGSTSTLPPYLSVYMWKRTA